MTERAFPLRLPSLARVPSTVTTSPLFRELRDQPRRIRPLGLASSNAQSSGWPLPAAAHFHVLFFSDPAGPSQTSEMSTWNQACGFVHSSDVTLPVTLTSLAES